jgi:tRNA nucleotidyltransferase/poly(A) polymerase
MTLHTTKARYYLVGGFVRDKLLEVKSKDVDLAVEAESYEAMKEDLLKQGVKIFLETPQYWTIRGTHSELGAVDYVLCRKDGEYTDHRRPDEVFAGSIYDDLARRDFTINAIAIDMETKEFLDPHHGQIDLGDRILRAVGNAEERFQEDPLRVLRGIRFAIKYNLQIEARTMLAMINSVPLIETLPEDRIRDELIKCFKINTYTTLMQLEDFGLTSIIFDNPKYSLWLEPTSKDK